MGFDLTRFQGDVDEELICPICSGVLEEPLQVFKILYYFNLLIINSYIHFLGCSLRTCILS